MNNRWLKDWELEQIVDSTRYSHDDDDRERGRAAEAELVRRYEEEQQAEAVEQQLWERETEERAFHSEIYAQEIKFGDDDD
jgi:hypothetical protein